jgi:hypothetical protein
MAPMIARIGAMVKPLQLGAWAARAHMIKPGPDTDGDFSISSLRRPGRQREE